MIYAVSDIHGCYDKYKKLLKKINFGSDDIFFGYDHTRPSRPPWPLGGCGKVTGP